MIDCKNTIDTLREVAAEVIAARITGRLKDESLQSAHAWLIAASVVLEQVAQERDAAVQDIYMTCMCDVCTRSCKYDKPNPYCECADFEWRGPYPEDGGSKDGTEATDPE